MRHFPNAVQPRSADSRKRSMQTSLAKWAKCSTHTCGPYCQTISIGGGGRPTAIVLRRHGAVLSGLRASRCASWRLTPPEGCRYVSFEPALLADMGEVRLARGGSAATTSEAGAGVRAFPLHVRDPDHLPSHQRRRRHRPARHRGAVRRPRLERPLSLPRVHPGPRLDEGARLPSCPARPRHAGMTAQDEGAHQSPANVPPPHARATVDAPDHPDRADRRPVLDRVDRW